MPDDQTYEERRDDDIALCTHQALVLLDHIDPYVFAIQASATGITLFPRSHYPRITTWEQTLLQTEFTLPSDWTGALSRLKQIQTKECETLSATAQDERSKWQAQQASLKGEAVAFSLIRLHQRMQGYKSDGATPMTTSTRDASQSISQGRFGRRLTRKTAKHSS